MCDNLASLALLHLHSPEVVVDVAEEFSDFLHFIQHVSQLFFGEQAVDFLQVPHEKR